MASTLGIALMDGALRSVRNYADDTVVADTLLKFYAAASLGPLAASNQAKLDAVVEWIELQIVEGARRYERALRLAALENEINEEIGLK